MSQTTSWMEWSLALVIALNPLSYGVAGLRRLLYLDGASAPLPEALPELSTCWLVTLGFAVVMFVLASLTARRRTTGDLL
jgi:hypothetical protein